MEKFKIKALAAYRGGIINVDYAESFYLIREINYCNKNI